MKQSNIQIMLIDDDEDDYILTRDLLMSIDPSGYKLDWINNASQASSLFREDKYDLYLMDYRLADVTGIDLIRLAREIGNDRPVIILTGKGDKKVDMEAMRSGADDYLVKDRIDGFILERAIRYAVGRWQQNQALRHSEEKYRKIFEQSKDVIYITSLDGTLLDFNESACTLFGYSREELLQMNASSLYWNERDRTTFQEYIRDNHEVRDYEVTLRNKKGEKIYCLLTTSLQPDEEKGFVYQGLIHDITKRKKYEEDLVKAEKFEVSGRIARMIAHEIRNPLMNIDLSLSQIISEFPSENPEAVTFYDIIKRNSKRINELVTALLNSSKPKVLEKSTMSIHKLLDETLMFAEDRIRLKNIKLTKEYGDKVGDVIVDPENMKIAVNNIIINAVEAMQENKGELLIRTEAQGDKCIITIRDNGSGITPENLAKLFDPYFSTKPTGMGLGLTDTYNIIKTHNGSLHVESELNLGTTFTITLDMSN